MSGNWFVAVWMKPNEKDELQIESSEMRGRFENSAIRDDAIDELKEEDTSAKLVIIPIDVEGDEDATLEVGS